MKHEDLINQLYDALRANQVFHTPIALRRRGGEWDEYEMDAIKRTREALNTIQHSEYPVNFTFTACPHCQQQIRTQ